MNKDQLKELIQFHDRLYYEEGAPEISDAEYDALRKQLLTVDKEILDYVPGEATGLYPKYEHSASIKSLGKVNDIASLEKELERLLPVTIEPKFDGLTIVIYPEKQIVTRGDGSVGDDISINASQIPNIKYMNEPVRAEAMLSIEEFNKINTERIAVGLDLFKNPRNAAAGILRSKDSQYLDRLTYRAYNIVGSELQQSEQISKLHEMGFLTSDSHIFEVLENAVEFVQNFDRSVYPFELDGLVIKSDIPNANNVFGETGHHPKSMVAYKFQAQGGWTKLLDVKWTVGRTGKIVPNARLEPIEILGTTVDKATLHNIAYMDTIKLSRGCQVNVIKANDVIPAIIESKGYNPLINFKAPKVCPDCSTSLEKVKDQLYCRNDMCSSRLVANITTMVARDRLDITGMSEQTIVKMLELNPKIKNHYEVLDITAEEIVMLPGFAEKSTDNLYKAIQAAKKQPLDRAFAAACIPNIGRSASKDMANLYGSFEEFLKDYHNDFERLQQLDGFGYKMINSLKQNINVLSGLVIRLEEIVPVETKAEVSSNALTICVTGKFEGYSREDFQALIESLGHKFATSVTKSTTHLVAGEKAGSKLAKAQDAGIPVMTSYSELLDLISQEQ